MKRIVLKVGSALATVAFAIAALMLVWMVQVAVGVMLNPDADIRPANPVWLVFVAGLVALGLYGVMRAAWAAVDRFEAASPGMDETPRPKHSPP
jgi:hypothetical protein